MRWVGPSWNAPMCQPATELVPTEQQWALLQLLECPECLLPIERGCRLVLVPHIASSRAGAESIDHPWHAWCWIKHLVGSEGLAGMSIPEGANPYHQGVAIIEETE